MSEWISVDDNFIKPFYNKPILVTDGQIIDIGSLTLIDNHLKAWNGANKLKKGVTH